MLPANAKIISAPDRSYSIAILDGEAIPLTGPAQFAPEPPPRPPSIQTKYLGSALPLPLDNPEPTLQIICTDDYLRPDVAAALHPTLPTLLIRPLGKLILIGPLIKPDRPACWNCLANWLRIRRWRQAAITNWTGDAYPPDNPTPATPAAQAACLGFVLSFIDKFTREGDIRELHQHILTYDAASLTMSRVRILTSSACAQCATPVVPGLPEKLQSLANPVTGIAESIHVAASKSPPIHLAVARIFAPFPNNPHLGLIPPLSASGRGRTQSEALQILMMEAAERHSLIWDGHRQTAPAPLPFLLAGLTQISQTQQANEYAHWIPLPAAAHAESIMATALTNNQEILIPAACAYLNFRGTAEPNFYEADSNGCAAGATADQALRHALLELIERDALAIWWYNQIPRPMLDPDPESLAAMNAAGRTLHLFDITTDIAIPVVVAVSADDTGRTIYIGAAADLDSAAAARRAAGELIQFWFWDQRGSVAASRVNWLAEGSLERFSFLQPNKLATPAQAPQNNILTSLAACGLHAFSVDLTRPDLGVPVVRAIVPNLRTHRRRLGPGRLYDVPVKLGWLQEPRAESAMNPFEPPL